MQYRYNNDYNNTCIRIPLTTGTKSVLFSLSTLNYKKYVTIVITTTTTWGALKILKSKSSSESSHLVRSSFSISLLDRFFYCYCYYVNRL